MTHPFRFGVELKGPLPGLTWAQTAQRLEELGYSNLVVPDHFDDQFAVGPALAAAAAATTTLRLGAHVYCNDYRHPVMLAKEVATLDILSGGRMDLGLGAGWKRVDYVEAGLDYDPPGVRIEHGSPCRSSAACSTAGHLRGRALHAAASRACRSRCSRRWRW